MPETNSAYLYNNSLEKTSLGNTVLLPVEKENGFVLNENYDYPLDNHFNKYVKRTFDIAFSLLVIILLLSWIFPVLAILIKSTSTGPIFFKQKRTGVNNHPFWCWKLRSMYVNNEAHTKQASANDPRITPIGKFLRKFSLDEIPQFYNVLKGNMSVVGPRPHMLSHSETYSKTIARYMQRHYVRPGITGLSQVEGYRGEIKNERMIRNRVRLDLFYIEKWKFALDMYIIAKTIKLMLFGDKHAY
jgi:putative colanic acid biosynthesis UDP-glucose lipid carrier transferase